MNTIEVESPRDLLQNLGLLSSMNVRHLRVYTHSNFWYKYDSIANAMRFPMRFPQSLEHLEFVGESYPNVFDLVRFLTFLRDRSCNLKTLHMPVSPPFPGQYRIQDRTSIINELLYLIHSCRSIVSASFRCKRSSIRDEEWVRRLNTKVASLLRNKQDKSHL